MNLSSILLLKEYNSQVVLFGVIVYSIGSALIGVFLLLQKRLLISDSISHATLPGITIAFIICSTFGLIDLSRNTNILLFGGLITALLSVFRMRSIKHNSFFHNDILYATTISVYFGLGIALLGMSQRFSQGNSSGLLTFIYGNTASMIFSDAIVFLVVSTLILLFILVFWRQLSIFSFDPQYASTVGMPVNFYDSVMLYLISIQTIVGIQAVGIVLVNGILIIPPVAARFWHSKLVPLIIITIVISMSSCYIGAVLSAVYPGIPTGSVIITVAMSIFLLSLLFGSYKGVVKTFISRSVYARIVAREHLLRRALEQVEEEVSNFLKKEGYSSEQESESEEYSTESKLLTYASRAFSISSIASTAGLTRTRALKECKFLESRGYLTLNKSNLTFYFTKKGLFYALSVLRRHKLWELYFMTYTNASPQQIDFSADTVEHAIGQEASDELSAQIKTKYTLTRLLGEKHH